MDTSEDKIRTTAENILCGGGDSQQWQNIQAVARAYLDLKAMSELILKCEAAYESQLEIVSRVLGKLHPIGEVKFIGYLEIEEAISQCLEMVIEELDPEMPRHHIVRLREKFIAAKSAISQ